jgi:putative membrane protein
MEGARRFIAGVSAVNTANVVFNLVALVTLLKVRSGTSSAVQGLMGWTGAPWGDGSILGTEVMVLLVSCGVGGVVAAPVTLLAGRWALRARPFVSHRNTLFFILLALVCASVYQHGWAGLMVVFSATALGMVPPLLGLMRVHLMGSVILPLALGLILV